MSPTEENEMQNDVDPRQVACASKVARRYGFDLADVETFGENNSDTVSWEAGPYSGLWTNGEIHDVEHDFGNDPSGPNNVAYYAPDDTVDCDPGYEAAEYA